MTTVVAAARDGIVAMAADSLTNVYERPIVNGARKIRRIKVGEGEALLGFCGSGGLTAAVYDIKFDDEPDPAKDADVAQWAATVAGALQDWAADAGLTEGGRIDGSILLGWRGRLWTISEIQAIPHPDGRAALGSGEGPAIGALDVLLDHLDADLPDAVIEAVKVGINRDRNSAAPFYLEVLR